MSTTTPELYACEGLFAWTLSLENGDQLVTLASSLQAALTGVLPSPVIGATRGAPFVPGDDVPRPLTSLTPPSAKVGDPNFTLHVIGTGFKATDVIVWNGVATNTTFVSATELTTPVNMATLTTPSAVPVQVRTIAGQMSNTLTFDLQPT